MEMPRKVTNSNLWNGQHCEHRYTGLQGLELDVAL